MGKELIYRLTRKDFKVEAIRGSGKGGQHRNKKATGQRITHPESGAVGVATDSKSQAINRKAAFRRMYESAEFQFWHRVQCGQHSKDATAIEREVERMMHPSNLQIEYGPPGSFK